VICPGALVVVKDPHEMSGKTGIVICIEEVFEDFRNHWLEAVVKIDDTLVNVEVDFLTVKE